MRKTALFTLVISSLIALFLTVIRQTHRILALRTSGAALPYAQSARHDYSRPLAFEPNRGQTTERVDFLAHAPGYNLFLSRGEAVMKLAGVRRGRMAVRVRPLDANLSTQVSDKALRRNDVLRCC